MLHNILKCNIYTKQKCYFYVELSVYNGIPHLLLPVVTDPKKAAGALNWAVNEMTDRYKKFAAMQVRNIKGYNDVVVKKNKEGIETSLVCQKESQKAFVP